MGTSSSTPINFSNEEIIREEMLKYASQWKGNGQTELFRTHVPVEPVDFTEKYKFLGFDKVFTSDKISTKIKWGDFNSLHLFRSSLGVLDHEQRRAPLDGPERDLPGVLHGVEVAVHVQLRR